MEARDPGDAEAEMADIFISYATEDRILASELASKLQKRGYTVWWDRELVSGDNFRDEIVNQIALAKSVVVIWTSTSIRKDWVLSEAQRAHSQKKLSPVRHELAVAQIPHPSTCSTRR